MQIPSDTRAAGVDRLQKPVDRWQVSIDLLLAKLASHADQRREAEGGHPGSAHCECDLDDGRISAVTRNQRSRGTPASAGPPQSADHCCLTA
jgi:hypothetical protein